MPETKIYETYEEALDAFFTLTQEEQNTVWLPEQDPNGWFVNLSKLNA